MDGDVRHLVGLLLGAAEDWHRAFEFLITGIGPVCSHDRALGASPDPAQPARPRTCTDPGMRATVTDEDRAGESELAASR